MEIDAVHLAIGLVYYGLLRVPSKEQQSETGIRKCIYRSVRAPTDKYATHDLQ
jgi:hypothetical protein